MDLISNYVERKTYWRIHAHVRTHITQCTCANIDGVPFRIRETEIEIRKCHIIQMTSAVRFHLVSNAIERVSHTYRPRRQWSFASSGCIVCHFCGDFMCKSRTQRAFNRWTNDKRVTINCHDFYYAEICQRIITYVCVQNHFNVAVCESTTPVTFVNSKAILKTPNKNKIYRVDWLRRLRWREFG